MNQVSLIQTQSQFGDHQECFPLESQSSLQNWELLTNHLMIVDLVDDRFARRYEGDMGTENTRIVGVYQSKLFFDVAQEGILVVDVQTPNIPKGLHFQRTPGWTKHISFYGKYAFLSAGHFGIYTLDLETSTF